MFPLFIDLFEDDTIKHLEKYLECQGAFINIEHPLYKSAQLAKPSKEQISNTQAAEISGSGSNFAEFYSPRPLNNDGTGELKTSKSGSPEETGFTGVGVKDKPINNG